MAAITWSDVTTIAAPELSGLAVAAQTAILVWVNAAFDVTVFDGEDGAKTKLARVYLAAHIGTLILPTSAGGSGGGVSGPVSSESAGGLSRSYAVAVASSGGTTAENLSRTGYGQLLLLLINTSGARSPIVIP